MNKTLDDFSFYTKCSILISLDSAGDWIHQFYCVRGNQESALVKTSVPEIEMTLTLELESYFSTDTRKH